MLEFLFKEFDFITEFVKEGNYGEVNATVVVKSKQPQPIGDYNMYYVSYTDGDDIDDVYKKLIGTYHTEKEATAEAEDYFDKNIIG